VNVPQAQIIRYTIPGSNGLDARKGYVIIEKMLDVHTNSYDPNIQKQIHQQYGHQLDTAMHQLAQLVIFLGLNNIQSHKLPVLSCGTAVGVTNVSYCGSSTVGMDQLLSVATLEKQWKIIHSTVKQLEEKSYCKEITNITQQKLVDINEISVRIDKTIKEKLFEIITSQVRELLYKSQQIDDFNKLKPLKVDIEQLGLPIHETTFGELDYAEKSV
jgi:hypothetical protein